MIALIALLLAQAAPSRVLTLEEAQRLAQERQPQLRAARGSKQIILEENLTENKKY